MFQISVIGECKPSIKGILERDIEIKLNVYVLGQIFFMKSYIFLCIRDYE